jgi:hypothetical protein
MKTQQTNPGTPWSLHLDRDGTEDFLIVCDPEGNDIVRSEFFWQPESDDEPLPMAMTAVWLMFKAQRLLAALKTLAEQADHDCPAHARSCYFIDALEQANAVIDEATARPPYIRKCGPGLPADAPGKSS